MVILLDMDTRAYLSPCGWCRVFEAVQSIVLGLTITLPSGVSTLFLLQILAKLLSSFIVCFVLFKSKLFMTTRLLL